MDLDSPVELLEPLLFVLNRLLEQVCARLRMHILAIGEIKVTLTLERNDSRNKEPLFHIRTTRLPAPARDTKLLLKLLQLDLEKHPFLACHGSPRVDDPREGAIPAARAVPALSPHPERLEITLKRIENTVGKTVWRAGAA